MTHLTRWGGTILGLAGAAVVAALAVTSAPVHTATQGGTGAQTSPPSDAEVFGRYRTWMASQPPDQRSAAAYRQTLKAAGASDAEADRQIAIITRDGARLEAERWNQFFTAERPRFNLMPNAFLVQMAEGRSPGKALDVGMGQGRNAIWLARQGWDVTGFDPADKAVAIAEQSAATLGVRLKTVVATDDTFEFGQDQWDLIVLSYVGCSQLAGRVERALKPGGLVVVESFHTDAAKDHRIGGSLCGTGELPHVFQGLRTVRYEEPIVMPDFGPERMRVVRFAAQKP